MAALGEGHLDALFGILGLLLGSWAYAEGSTFFKNTIEAWGNYGPLTFPQLLGVSSGRFIVAAVVALLGLLLILEAFRL